MRVAAFLLLLLVGSVAHADDWTEDIETITADSMCQSDLLLWGTQSLDFQIGWPWTLNNFLDHKTVVADCTSSVSALDVSQSEVSSSAGAGQEVTVRRAYASVKMSHEGTTDQVGVTAWGALWGSSEADAYLTPTHGGVASGTITMRCDTLDFLGQLNGQPMDQIESVTLQSIAGNTVVQWTYDGDTDRWTRSGQINRVVDGENELTPLPALTIDGWDQLHRDIDEYDYAFAEVMSDEYDELQIYSRCHVQGAENWITGTYSFSALNAQVEVAVDGTVQQ